MSNTDPAQFLGEPSFRLSWREDNGRYTVNKPDIGDTDCYTRDAVIAAVQRALEAQQQELADAKGREQVIARWAVQALQTLATIDPEDTQEAEELAALCRAGDKLTWLALDPACVTPALAAPQQAAPAPEAAQSHDCALQRGSPLCRACDLETIAAAEAAQAQPAAVPLFWYRPCSDGNGWEGPVDDARLEPVRKTSGAWVPLYAAPQAAVPQGWVLVPLEPTEEMQDAGEQAFCATARPGATWAEHTGAIYRAMLAARPQAEPTGATE